MAYQKTLARIRPTRGAAPDLPYWEATPEFYSIVRNMVIRNGFATRIPGYRQAYDPLSVAPLHIQNVRDLGTNFWVYFGASSIYSVNGGTHTDLTPGGGLTAVTKPSQWNTTLLNGIPIANNGLDDPMYWTGDTVDNYAALTDWPANTLAALLVAFRYHLFAFDITVSGTNNPNQFLWSDAADPGAIPSSWTASASTEAGDNQLSDKPGRIITARPLRDSLIVYKENSSYAIDYIGGNEVFATRGLWSRCGALSPRAVDDINGAHVIVTDGDIVIGDGYKEPVSIANALVKRFLFSQLSDTTYEALQVIYDQSRQQVWIAFPESGEDYCTLALVYNISSNAWGIVELTDVAHLAMGAVDDQTISEAWDDDNDIWDSDASIWNEVSLSTATESLVVADPTNTELRQFDTVDAVAVASSVARYSLSLDEPERVKFVRAVHVRGSNFGTLFIRVGSQMHPEDAITWSAEYELTSPDQPCYVFAAGRYISVEIRCEDSNVWTVTGFDLEVEFRGFY